MSKHVMTAQLLQENTNEWVILISVSSDNDNFDDPPEPDFDEIPEPIGFDGAALYRAHIERLRATWRPHQTRTTKQTAMMPTNQRRALELRPLHPT